MSKEKISYSGLEDAKNKINAIADGLSEKNNRVKEIIDILLENDLNANRTTPEIQNSVYAMFKSVNNYIENLRLYASHLSGGNGVVQQSEATDQSVGADWHSLSDAVADATTN